MLFTVLSMATTEVVATLRGTPQCTIVRGSSDDETGDPVILRCGDSTKPIARVLKGLSADRISDCEVVITIYAVHRPKIIGISNCSGTRVTNLSRKWVEHLQAAYHITNSRIEYVDYKKSYSGLGCYKVTITFDANKFQHDPSFSSKSGTYCLNSDRIP